MLKRSSIVALVAMAATATAAAAPPRSKAPAKPAAGKAAVVPVKFGALAVDRSRAFTYAWAYDHPSRAAAAAFARAECAKLKGNCSVVVEFSGPGCAAYNTLSATDGSAYGWGADANQGAAQSRALSECNTRAKGRAMCSNNVWSCNSGSGAYKVLYLEPVTPGASPTDCLIQFEANVYSSPTQWVSRFHSPVYRLARKDCPASGDSPYSTFGFNDHPGERSSFWEVAIASKDPAKMALGHGWAKSFLEWGRARALPFPGLRLNQSGSVSSVVPLPPNVTHLVEDAGDKAGVTRGWCIDYAPPGVTPIEVLGAEKCQRWWR